MKSRGSSCVLCTLGAVRQISSRHHHRGAFASASANLFAPHVLPTDVSDKATGSSTREAEVSDAPLSSVASPQRVVKRSASTASDGGIASHVHRFMTSPPAPRAMPTAAPRVDPRAEEEEVLPEPEPAPVETPAASHATQSSSSRRPVLRPARRALTTPATPASSSTATATASLLRALRKDSPRATVAPAKAPPTSSSSSSVSSPAQTPPPRPVSAAFLTQLASSVRAKQLDWGGMTLRHPELPAMPLYTERQTWTGVYGRHHAAVPVSDGHLLATCAVPVFLCTAPTGAGKSVLMCLCFLDAHWRAVEAAVVAAAGAVGGRDTTCHTDGDQGVVPPVNDLSAFAGDMKQRSRVCIVVSQPTRLACVQLAKYTASLLAARASPAEDGEDDDDREDARDGAVGGRVGYAVGGDVCFTENTEIVFATAGYILNALQHRSGGGADSSRLRPTTLIIDEAHCRDVETDLLLAFVRLQRVRVEPSRWALRQVVVMSATLNAAAMLAFFDSRSHSSSGSADPTHALPPSPPIWMLTPAQQRAVASAEAAVAVHTFAPAAASDSSPPLPFGVPRYLLVPGGEPHALTTQAVLSAVDGAAGAGPYPVERYFLDDLAPPQAGARGVVADDGRTSHSSAQHSGLQASKCLFPWLRSSSAVEAEQHPSATRTRRGQRKGAARGRRGGDDSRVAQTTEHALLPSHDGLVLLHHLQSTFSTRFYTATSSLNRRGAPSQTSVQLYGPQASRIAELVLQLLQALRLRRDRAETSSSSSTAIGMTEAPEAPDTVLLFLPGFAEIQLVLQALERRCTRSNRAVTPLSPLSAGAASPGSPAEPITVLQYGKETFSVPILHAAAIGSPQEWLRITGDITTAPRQRLILATNVAESSLTIPGVAVVVDTCLERRFLADAITGTTRKLTTLASLGSLQQRCGRAGRTQPGVVIHLAPRSLFTQAAAAVDDGGRSSPDSAASVPTASAGAVVDVPAFEPLADSPATILLRVKSLFATQHDDTRTTSSTSPLSSAAADADLSVSRVLASMPRPLSNMELEAAYQQLVDMDLLLPPQHILLASPPESTGPLHERLNRSTLSPKGRLIALLPIPMESALLVFHAFSFACVEDAVLVACAMTVPSLFTTPRLVTDARTVRVSLPQITDPVSARTTDTAAASSPTRRETLPGATATRGDGEGGGVEDDAAVSPLEHYRQHLAVQRHLARIDAAAAPAASGAAGTDAMEKLSEPLVLWALLREWYASPSSLHLMELQNKYHLNRSAMRNVDVAIAQTCQRLLQCLAKLGPANDGRTRTEKSASASSSKSASLVAETEDDAHDYFMLRASTAPPPLPVAASERFTESALPRLIDPLWPPRFEERLSRSLYRLRHAALARASHRLTATHSPREGLPQWYGADREMTLLIESVFRGGDGGDAGDEHHHPYRGAGGGGRRRQSHATERLHPSLDTVDSAARLSTTSSTTTTTTTRRVGESLAQSLREALPQHRRRADLLAAQRDPALSAFDLGPVEARLRAAFVAAFARHTLHGTDGGYRRHHRRLTRNMDALRVTRGTPERAAGRDGNNKNGTGDAGGEDDHGRSDEMDVASFNVDVRVMDGVDGTQPSQRESARAALTPSALLWALRAFLGADRVAQVELFREKRTAVVRFTRTRERPTNNSTNNSTSTQAVSETDTDSVSPSAVLLHPSALPRRVYHALVGGRDTPSQAPASSSSRTPVGLAPFGYSLLVAAQSVMQRLPIELPLNNNNNGSVDTSPGVSDGNVTVERSTSAAASVRVASSRAGAPLSALDFHGVGHDAEVRWFDHAYGTQRILRKADVEALGLSVWYPNPPPPLSSPQPAPLSHSTTTEETSSAGADESSPADPTTSTSSVRSQQQQQQQSAVWSVVSPLNITRGIYWKVGLPSVSAWWWGQHTLTTQRRTTTPTATVTATTDHSTARAMAYCPVCHCVCVDAAQRATHSRSVAHLRHLHFAVQHRLDIGQVNQVLAMAEAGGEETAPYSTPLHKALFATTSSSAITPHTLPLEFFPCRLSSLSFLNALQWSPTSAATPLAVAGALVSSTASASASLVASAEATVLTAHHVWLVPPVVPEKSLRPARRVSGEVDAPSSSSLTTSGAVLSTSALLTLAGFLTASTRRTPATFLFNADHTHVFAVQLRGRGMWSFASQPLPAGELGALSYTMQGGAWPGVVRLAALRADSADASSRVPSREGLHWCVPSATSPCPGCTYYAPTVEDDAAVVAVMLLVLHEYVQAERRMVTLADYMERVIAKLDVGLPASSSSSSSASRGAARLARFFQQRRDEAAAAVTQQTRPDTNVARQRRRSHNVPVRGSGGRALLAGDSVVSTLQSVGCQFLVPPQALARLDGGPDTNDGDGSGGGAHARAHDKAREVPQALSTVALAVQGATLEMQFTVPTVLPTYLPTSALYDCTRAFYESRHGAAAGAGHHHHHHHPLPSRPVQEPWMDSSASQPPALRF